MDQHVRLYALRRTEPRVSSMLGKCWTGLHPGSSRKVLSSLFRVYWKSIQLLLGQMLCRTHFHLVGWHLDVFISMISSATLFLLVPLSIQWREMPPPTIPRRVRFLYPALPDFVRAFWKPGCFQHVVAFSTLSTLINVSGYGFLWIQVLEAKDWGFVGVCLFVVFPNWGSVAFICSDTFSGSSHFNPSPSRPLISEFPFSSPLG